MSAGVATAKAADVQPAEEADRMQVDAHIDGPEEDLYTRLKTLQRQLEFLEIQVSGAAAPAGRGGGGSPSFWGRGAADRRDYSPGSACRRTTSRRSRRT
jgi:hypothetical protein